MYQEHRQKRHDSRGIISGTAKRHTVRPLNSLGFQRFMKSSSKIYAFKWSCVHCRARNRSTLTWIINAHREVSVVTWARVVSAAWAKHCWSECIDGRVSSASNLKLAGSYDIFWTRGELSGPRIWRYATNPIEKTILENAQVKQKLEKSEITLELSYDNRGK